MTNEESKCAGPASVSTDQLERAAFEAWVSAPPFEYCISRFSADDHDWPGCYQVLSVDLAWHAWREAKKSEREACHQACRELAKRMNTADELDAANSCAEVIYMRSNA